VAIWESAGAQAPAQVAHLLRREDFTGARGSLHMLPRARRERLQHHARRQVDGPYNPANFPDSFEHLIERFQAGPPDEDEAEVSRPQQEPCERTPEIPRTFPPLGRDGYTSTLRADRCLTGPPQALHLNAATRTFLPKHIRFDGSMPVVTYITRLQAMARRYTEATVLANLPLAMEGDASTWMDGLPPTLLQCMDDSLEEWFTQLRLRFAVDISEVLAQADALRHSFAQEDVLDLRQYLSQKIQLYREAGETSEDAMVRRTHRDLDAELGRDVRLRASGNSLAEFQAQVIHQAPSSRRAWQQGHASMQVLIQQRFAARPYGRDRERMDTRERTELRDVARRFEPPPPRYLPFHAARQLAPPLQRLLGTTPPNTPTAPATARRSTRPQYPCTHCGSVDHIDPDCPKNPRRLAANTRPATALAAPPAAQPVRAYFAEAFDTATEEDPQDLVKVDEETFAAYEAGISDTTENAMSGPYGATALL
jgi:hypothetical protein